VVWLPLHRAPVRDAATHHILLLPHLHHRSLPGRQLWARKRRRSSLKEGTVLGFHDPFWIDNSQFAFEDALVPQMPLEASTSSEHACDPSACRTVRLFLRLFFYLYLYSSIPHNTEGLQQATLSHLQTCKPSAFGTGGAKWPQGSQQQRCARRGGGL
jgi:hypothetical protein